VYLRIKSKNMRTHFTLLLIIFSLHAIGQSCTISGIVTDEKKEPIIDAFVFINGKGYVTDYDGRYRTTLPQGIYNFACSYVGFKTKKLDNVRCLKDTIVLNFVMDENKKSLDEVVVFSYKKSQISKGDTKVEMSTTSEDIKNSGMSVDVVAGTVAGVSVSDDKAVYFVSGHKMKDAEGIDARNKTEVSPSGSARAGVLTSGEVNDFSKWTMWSDLTKGEFEAHSKNWGFYPRHRYMTEVKNEAGFPVCGAIAKLLDKKENEIWTARTDNTGKAELWADMFEYDTTHLPEYHISVSYMNQEKTIQRAAEFPNGYNRVVLQAECGASNDVDIVFTVDATGSMGDEINYLKTELLDVIHKAASNNHHLNISLGSVFYRDHGDEYLTKISPLDADINTTYNFVKAQSAAGGGDFPEAVDEALKVTLDDIKWHENARAKIVFLILDAPPHDNPDVIKRLDALMMKAAEKGVRIVPLACSGVDKSTEYILRSFALATNGTYTFLTIIAA